MLKVKKLSPEAVLPARATSTDAGYDLVAIDDGVWGENNTYIQYKTGIAVEVPDGYHTEIFPRSSISKTHLSLANSIGLVDHGYRGELLLRFKGIHNGGNTAPIIYKKGDKIGQLVIRKTESLPVVEVTELSDTDRGTGGFGSTDKK